MPKAFSEQEKEIIGNRLLENGHRLFSAYGLKKTSVEEIALASGISKGSFYSFYASKEALFMDVVEQVEADIRQQILAVVDQPGSSARARLFAVLKKAFALFLETPVLQFFTGSDFDQLFRRIPADKLQGHLASDRAFIETLVVRCRQVGIPIQAPTGQIVNLLYWLVLAVLHEDNPGLNAFEDGIHMHLELVAAFCLGEVRLQLQEPSMTAVETRESRYDT
jgi:AcrR family transcriptional regulator